LTEPDPPRGPWARRDFVRLWSAATVSNFGTMVTGMAFPFVAIELGATTPTAFAILRNLTLLPSFLLGLPAGAWIDRRRKLPVLVVADLARAACLASIPIAALGGWLRIEQLYGVLLANGLFSLLFGIADHALLPAIVPREELVAANGALKTGDAVTETSAFAVGGWLVQWLTAPIALAVDAASYVVSALCLVGIRAEPPARARAASTHARSLRSEVASGVGVLLGEPRLRALALAALLEGASVQLASIVYMLYASQELGFAPGWIGLMAAVGSVASVAGAALAPRASRRIGVGWLAGAGHGAVGLALLLLSLAPGTTLIGVALVVAHQLSDAPATAGSIATASLFQGLTPGDALGRVNAALRFATTAGMLLAGVAGAVLGEAAGLRGTLVAAALLSLGAALCVARSPVVALREIGPAPAGPAADREPART
jgi:MFS family permease